MISYRHIATWKEKHFFVKSFMNLFEAEMEKRKTPSLMKDKCPWSNLSLKLSVDTIRQSSRLD